MFDELSVMAWLGSAIILAIGGGAGFFVARQIKDKRTLELEQQLDAAQNKLTDYQDDVNRHFLKTSLLFNKLTDDYREVYEHLATGAQKLCNEKTRITALDLPETKILSAAVAADTNAVLTVDEKLETGMVTTEQVDTEHDDTTQISAENFVATESLNPENISTKNTDATSVPTAGSENAGPDDHLATIEHEAEKQTAEEQANTEQTTEPMTEKTAATESTESEAISIETKNTEGRPTISAKELKILEANEKKQAEEEDIHLGAESTPGVELEHHKTHPSIH